jgi:predicted metalloprotease with PDZ domain
LLADVEIRERTHNRRSLDDAIRRIWSEGGDGSADWSAERVLKEGDRATGLSVLANLHEKMGEKPGDVDLPALWKRLGVVYADGRVTFDDNAPLANVRKALTDRPNLYKAGIHR